MQARLERVLAPYLWIEVFGQPAFTPGITVRGMVKMQGQPAGQEPPASLAEMLLRANLVRASLFGTAQTAIIAVEEAGFAHNSHPEIRVGGTIKHGGGPNLDILVAEVTVLLDLYRTSVRR